MGQATSIGRFYKTLIVICFTGMSLQGQVNAYFASGVFNTPANQPFAETWLTFAGGSLKSKTLNGQKHSSVNVNCIILKDSSIVRANKYNISGPLSDTAAATPSFLDVQRYSLPNGEYQIELSITDNNDPAKKTLLIKDRIRISFSGSKAEASSIEPVESFRRAEKMGALTRSGYDLVPYTINYYPGSVNELAFYFEAYNMVKELGHQKPFVFTWFIETSDRETRLSNYGSFRKQQAAVINPLLAKMDISKLGTGNYNLVIEARDENNQLLLKQKYYFQRVNRGVDVVALQQHTEKQHLAEYFGRVSNADTLKMFVECLWPIADGVDKERVINQAIKKDPELMKAFIVDFWQRRAADTANPLKMWASYYQSVQQAMKLFRCGKQPGYYTEMGRVYLQYGPPNQRAQQPNEHNTYPYEIWQYYRLTDATNGQFFSNRKFVFVNKMLGDDCYNLVHSDLRGEINNPRWQFEVTRRNTKGLADPDNTVPAGTQHNQFNEIYSNPR